VESEHSLIKCLCLVRPLEQMARIDQVAPCCWNLRRGISRSGILVAGDDRISTEGIRNLKSGKPVVDTRNTAGFCQIQMHAVVDDVARYEQPDFGHMQHCRRVGIGVADLHWQKGNTLKLKSAFIDDADLARTVTPRNRCSKGIAPNQ